MFGEIERAEIGLARGPARAVPGRSVNRASPVANPGAPASGSVRFPRFVRFMRFLRLVKLARNCSPGGRAGDFRRRREKGEAEVGPGRMGLIMARLSVPPDFFRDARHRERGEENPLTRVAALRTIGLCVEGEDAYAKQAASGTVSQPAFARLTIYK